MRLTQLQSALDQNARTMVQHQSRIDQFEEKRRKLKEEFGVDTPEADRVRQEGNQQNSQYLTGMRLIGKLLKGAEAGLNFDA